MELDAHGDSRGSLVALEKNHNVPFDIKRVYYIFDTEAGVPRGFHAHRELEQLLICVSGSCKIKLDTGKEQEWFELNRPTQALFVLGIIVKALPLHQTPFACFWYDPVVSFNRSSPYIVKVPINA